jgi:acetyltransferase-like isoleucine patch superfamily enzyme
VSVPGQRAVATPHDLIGAPPGAATRSPLKWAGRAWLVLLGLPKTLLFNLRYLPLRQALRLPILVSHRVALLDFRGRVVVRGPVRTGSVLLGFGSVGAFDYRRSRSVWQVDGEVVFDGPARLGNGFKLSVAGRVTFGAGFVLSAESQIVCQESITFGPGCLVSWDVLIIDSDFHPIRADDGSVSTLRAPVVLGERVWVGARACVLKGVSLASEVIVAAGAVVSRSEPASNVLIGGNPAQVLRRGVSWSH